jgi:hypothetical protein
MYRKRVVALVPPLSRITDPRILAAAHQAANDAGRVLTTTTPTVIPWPKGMWPHLIAGPLLVTFPTHPKPVEP